MLIKLISEHFKNIYKKQHFKIMPKMHDNYVKFTGDELVKGTFNVTDSKVPHNQGAINHDMMYFDDDKRLKFVVGRHGSTDVAEWFKSKLPKSNQNTFDHQPDKLNFAAMGDLTLTFRGDYYGDNERTFTFQNIVLAQGHAGGSNNWWFGGVGCENCGGHRVRITGKGQHEPEPYFQFHRGDSNNVDEVGVYAEKPSGFSYHMNEVKFVMEGDWYSIVEGKFTVTSHMVSKDQDPLGEVYDGLVTPLKGQSFNFRFGRHGSSDVANWFNDNIKSENHCTFKHFADELNFAIIGNLQLKIKGGIFGNGWNFIIESVALAQGHTDTSRNNWWFGGQMADPGDGKSVVCKARCMENEKEHIVVDFTFSRGGNDVNEVDVSIAWLKSWMWQYQRFIGHKKFTDLILPGTHDSGTYDMVTVVGRGWTKCQNLCIREQLEAGARVLDLRIGFQNSETGNQRFILVHDTWRTHITVHDALEQVKAFCSANNGEVVVLDFHRFVDLDGNSDGMKEELIEIVKNQLSDKMIGYERKDETLNDFVASSGRVIPAWNDKDTRPDMFWPGVNQEWFEKQTRDELYDAIKTFYEGTIPSPFWSCCAIITPGFPHISPIQSLEPCLHMWFSSNGLWALKSNIVSCDFIERTRLAESLVMANLNKL